MEQVKVSHPGTYVTTQGQMKAGVMTRGKISKVAIGLFSDMTHHY